MATPTPKLKTKWTWSMAFFVLFFASFLALTVTFLAWLALLALAWSLTAGSLAIMGEVCVVSFVLWIVTENAKSR
jgi:hypothetical protein